MTKKRRKTPAQKERDLFRDMAKEEMRSALAARDKAARKLVNVLSMPPGGFPVSGWLLWGAEVLSRAALAVEANEALERL